MGFVTKSMANEDYDFGDGLPDSKNKVYLLTFGLLEIRCVVESEAKGNGDSRTSKVYSHGLTTKAW
jgi:hypothetical protein